MLIVELIVLAYFLYVVLYTATFSVAGYFYKTPKTAAAAPSRFCVLLPAYKEDAVILDSAERAIMQRYPDDCFEVVVIADSLQPQTLARLRELPLRVIPVSFTNSTKVKSLNMALAELPQLAYDYAVILDSDNVMEPTFLEKMNNYLATYPSKAVQGQRKPKNQNNNLAFLDGVSEAINNHIYRQGQVALGLSSSISGSGVVFQYDLLRRKLAAMNSIGGFDRELELQLLLEGVGVRYYKEAAIYDEKVSKAQSFQNQRKRWISSQYVYLRKYFKSGVAALLKGNFTFFNSAVLRNIQLPRLINLGLLAILTAALFFVQPYLSFGYTIWVALLAVNVFSIFIAIPREFYSRQMLNAMLSIPGLFVNMFLLLFKLKNANKKFIHTPHDLHPAEAAEKLS